MDDDAIERRLPRVEYLSRRGGLGSAPRPGSAAAVGLGTSGLREALREGRSGQYRRTVSSYLATAVAGMSAEAHAVAVSLHRDRTAVAHEMDDGVAVAAAAAARARLRSNLQGAFQRAAAAARLQRAVRAWLARSRFRARLESLQEEERRRREAERRARLAGAAGRASWFSVHGLGPPSPPPDPDSREYSRFFAAYPALPTPSSPPPPDGDGRERQLQPPAPPGDSMAGTARERAAIARHVVVHAQWESRRAIESTPIPGPLTAGSPKEPGEPATATPRLRRRRPPRPPPPVSWTRLPPRPSTGLPPPPRERAPRPASAALGPPRGAVAALAGDPSRCSEGGLPGPALAGLPPGRPLRRPPRGVPAPRSLGIAPRGPEVRSSVERGGARCAPPPPLTRGRGRGEEGHVARVASTPPSRLGPVPPPPDWAAWVPGRGLPPPPRPGSVLALPGAALGLSCLVGVAPR